MAFTPVERMQIKNAIERVLHAPGNYSGGTLEMAVVFDCNLSKSVIRQIGKDIADLLKSHSEVFRNVRLNGICWEKDEVLVKELTSLPYLQMGRYFDDYECVKNRKRLELLTEQLKKFYARSKIILVFSDGDYQIKDERLYKESMHPFLYRKMILLRCYKEEVYENMQSSNQENEIGTATQAESENWKMELHTGMDLLRLK